jgi:2-C-methyl-D-erythritol 2,4-cyclodiphosphate synthase
VHRLTENRKLVLGGVDIPWHLGLEGHSDADVLLHAVTDALLGAAALGDIGRHFPDSDPKYKGISSLILLENAWLKISSLGYTLVNLDVTVIAQKPRLSPYIQIMAQNIAQTLQCAEDQVNIKATTEEHLGFTGREEGIAAHAVCILKKTGL